MGSSWRSGHCLSEPLEGLSPGCNKGHQRLAWGSGLSKGEPLMRGIQSSWAPRSSRRPKVFLKKLNHRGWCTTKHTRGSRLQVSSLQTLTSPKETVKVLICVCVGGGGGAPNETFTHIPREANGPPTYPPTSLPSPNQLFSISLLITDRQGSTDTI